MTYCLIMRERGLVPKPREEWDGNPGFKYTILGRSVSDYAKDRKTRKNMILFYAGNLQYKKYHAKDCGLISS